MHDPTVRVGDLVTREEFETACEMMDLLCALVLSDEVMARMLPPGEAKFNRWAKMREEAYEAMGGDRDDPA